MEYARQRLLLSHLHLSPQSRCYTNVQKSRTEPKQKTQKHATINDNDRTEHVALLRIIKYTHYFQLFFAHACYAFDSFRKLYFQRTYSLLDPNFRKTIAPRTLSSDRYTHCYIHPTTTTSIVMYYDVLAISCSLLSYRLYTTPPAIHLLQKQKIPNQIAGLSTLRAHTNTPVQTRNAICAI